MPCASTWDHPQMLVRSALLLFFSVLCCIVFPCLLVFVLSLVWPIFAIVSDLSILDFTFGFLKYVITPRINSTIYKDKTEMKERNRNTDHHSWLISGFVTRLIRLVPLVEQKLPTLPEHLSSPPVFSGVLLLDLYFYVYALWIVFCLYVLFLLAIVLSVLFRFTDCDYPYGIFKLFLTTSG